MLKPCCPQVLNSLLKRFSANVLLNPPVTRVLDPKSGIKPCPQVLNPLCRFLDPPQHPLPYLRKMVTMAFTDMACLLLTWPCFQHSLKIFQLLLLLGSCRQRRRPSHSHVWEVWGSSTLRPITPSLRATLPDSLPSVDPETRRPSAFLFSTTEAMMWSRMVGRPPFVLSAWPEGRKKGN